MKKINFWLFAAILLAVIIDPEESDPFWILFAWCNLGAAICCKVSMMNDEKETKDENAE